MRIAPVSGNGIIRLPWEANDKQELFRRQNGNDIFSELLAPFPPVCSGTSFRLVLVFKLTSRFYSGRDRAGQEKKDKDDNIPNNHLCRDWISGIPMAKAGGWKRLFRRLWPDPDLEIMMFGPADPDENEDENDACRGDLKFHHALFPQAKVGTALIGPRDEKTGVIDKGPITYEVLEAGGRCRLVIDYLPRNPDPALAAMALEKLIHTARQVQQDAIGGKSSIWGRISLVECRVCTGPDMKTPPESLCNQDSP